MSDSFSYHPVRELSNFEEVWKDQYWLQTAPISSYWKPKYRPVEFKIIYIAVYIGGIVEYGLKIISRILNVVRLILVTMVGCNDDNKRALAPALCQLGSAILGLILPPLAYYLDEQIAFDFRLNEWSWNYSTPSIPPPPSAPPPAPPSQRSPSRTKTDADGYEVKGND